MTTGTLIEGRKRRHEEDDLEMGHERQHVAPSREWNVNGSIREGDIRMLLLGSGTTKHSDYVYNCRGT